jgi:hypothetical protein
MQINRGVRMILSVGVLAVIGLLSTTARSDDKSAATFKQKCATCQGKAKCPNTVRA